MAHEVDLLIPSYEQQLSQEYVGILPTNAEQAAIGLKHFRDIIEDCPSELRVKMLQDVRLHGCFLGILPEINSLTPSLIKWATQEDLDNMDKLFHKYAPEIIMFREENSNCLVNLEASRRVVKNHQKYFDEYSHDPNFDWLTTNPNQWLTNNIKDYSIRYGLLSGYPLTAVLNFKPFIRAQQKLHSLIDIPNNTQDIQELINRSKHQLTSQEYELLNNSRTIQYLQNTCQFVGTSPKHDEMYAIKLDEIYEKSGIIELRREYGY